MRPRTVIKASLLAAAALALGNWSSTERGRQADENGFARVNGGHGPLTDRLYGGITELGSLYAAAAAAGALGLAGHRRAAAKAAAAAALTWVAGQALKKVFVRPRPYEADARGTRLMIGEPYGASWPSSHPAVLAAFLSVVGRELALGRPSRKLLGGLGNAVGVSRVYLGVHYPSDVAGGILLGRAFGELIGGS